MTGKILKKTDNVEIRDLGLADYEEVLKLQKQLHQDRLAENIGDKILIVEHKPVITLGARKTKNKLLVSQDDLKKSGITIQEVRRGGGATAHNPGQLVFYPILNLKNTGLYASDYVRKLEDIGIELLAGCGVNADRKKGFPGLWVGDDKIASIGVRVSKQVTFHGMAININNDLGIFENMIPCGLDNVKMTSVIKITGCETDILQLKNELCRIILKNFY